MTQTLFAWILTGAMLLSAYPWSAYLIARSPYNQANPQVLAGLMSIAIASGTLTLIMFWESMAGIRFDWWSITLPYFVLMIPGWLLWRRQAQSQSRMQFSIPAIFLVLIGAAVLFNAIYWPFSRADAVAIYHFFGLRMAEQAALVPLPGADTLYEAYPMHIPLTYTFAYLTSGWTNEYLARLYPALMSVGCIGAAYLLEKMFGGIGWFSAFLVAITPSYGRWASSGYVDLPMAFCLILSAVFAWRLWHSRHWSDALLAGAMMGLAAWTKNAALIGVFTLALWLAWAWLKQCIRWREAVLALTACAFVAAPWYLRNLIGAGLLIPDTVWTEQARASIDNLLILPRLYGIVGIILLVGFILTVVEFIRHRLDSSLLLLLWTVPLFVAWWIFASYDPRFILLILPVLCVMAGLWLSKLWHPRLALPGAVVLLILSLYTIWNSIEYKDELLRNPLMSDAAKHTIVAQER